MTDFTPEQLEAYAKYLPECVDCGACCHQNFDDLPTYVSLERGDLERIPYAKRDHVLQGNSIKTAYYRSGPKGRQERTCCAMLDKRCHKRCTIYNDRPTICRQFRRGGPECIREYLAFHKCLGRDV